MTMMHPTTCKLERKRSGIRWLRFACILICLSDVLPTEAQPALRIEGDPIYSFGQAFNTRSITNEWRLTNEATEAVYLAELTAECPLCTRVELTERLIPPGATRTLRVVLDGRAFTGPFHKSVIVTLAAPFEQTVRLSLAGEWLPAYELSDTVLHFYPSGNAEQTCDVTYRPLHDKPGTLTCVQSSDDRLTAELTVDPVNQSGSLRVLCKGEWPSGIHKHHLIVTGTHPKDPPLRIDVLIHQADEIDVFPPRLAFTKTNRPENRMVIVKCHNPAVDLRAIEAADPGLKARILGSNGQRNYRVLVSYDPRIVQVNAELGLNLHFSDGSQKVLAIDCL